MTEQQIKQNAWIDGYVVGAHSRDNEIKELKKRIEELEDEVAQLANGENY